MKKVFPILTLALSPLLHANATQLSDVSMPVLGTILNQSNSTNGIKYIVKSDSTKAHSPIEGSVYYVGNLKDYGLSVIVKSAHKVAIIGNLDRSYVVKNQFLFKNDSVGSVAYHSKVVFIVQQIQRVEENYDSTNSSLNFAQKFQDKLVDFAKNGTQVLRDIAQEASNGSLLNYHDISALLKKTGFPEKTIPTMYCIAKWESGLNPKALNYNNNNTVDVGLFQINSMWFKKCNANIATLYDEKLNSQCALTVYQNQGFPAWTTYNKNKNRGSADFCNM